MSLTPEPPDPGAAEIDENQSPSQLDTPHVLNETDNREPTRTTVDFRTVPIKELLTRKRKRDGLKLMPSTIRERQERKRKRLSERAGSSEPAGENPDQPEVQAGVDTNPAPTDDPSGVNTDQRVLSENDNGNGEAADDEEIDDVVAPQVIIDKYGNIIVDQASLVVSATVQAAEGDHDATTVEMPSSDAHVTSASFKKRDGPVKWSDGETARFYEALRSFGTDFSLMQHIFPSRSRGMLKRKFKREERENAEKVDQALCSPRDGTSRNLLTDTADTLPAPDQSSNQELDDQAVDNEQNNDIPAVNKDKEIDGSHDGGNDATNNKECSANNNEDTQVDQVVGRASDDEEDVTGDGSPNIDLGHADDSEFLDDGDGDGDGDDNESSDG